MRVEVGFAGHARRVDIQSPDHVFVSLEEMGGMMIMPNQA